MIMNIVLIAEPEWKWWWNKMSELTDWIRENVIRGACRCGKCIDAGPEPETRQPEGHTADLIFFEVALKDGARAKELKEILRNHPGDFNVVDIFDGQEHNYMELGGWVGDQGMAMMLMGAGSLMGLWKLMTPRTILGDDCDDHTVERMAGLGLVTIRVEAQNHSKPI